MRFYATLLLCAGLLLAAEAPGEDASKKDLELFQGAWRTVLYQQDGLKQPDDQIKDLRLFVAGNKRTVRIRGQILSLSTFKVDATKSPRWIDLIAEDRGMKGIIFPGIYEINKGTQRICYTFRGNERPKEFVADEDSGRVLQVFQRIKK